MLKNQSTRIFTHIWGFEVEMNASGFYLKKKCRQLWIGFELRSSVPFLVTILVSLSMPQWFIRKKEFLLFFIFEMRNYHYKSLMYTDRYPYLYYFYNHNVLAAILFKLLKVSFIVDKLRRILNQTLYSARGQIIDIPLSILKFWLFPKCANQYGYDQCQVFVVQCVTEIHPTVQTVASWASGNGSSI